VPDAALPDRRPAVPVAELVRHDFVEGRHHGSVVALAADGSVAWSVGAVDVPLLPRSCAKPLQAVGMVRAGLPLRGELLALAAASHSGEPFHVEGVRRVLAGAGLDEGALQTPPDLPLDDMERERVLADGGGRSRVAMNCSGKHAAMLATCVVNGWDTTTYLDPEHPVQRGIRTAIEELSGVPVEVTAVDGCGAPLLSTTLTGLARAFARLATSAEPAVTAVADAVRANPEWVSGTRRDEAALLRAVPGAVAKAGAEACYVVALADGRAVALKVEDGAPRARPVVMAAALERLGVLEEPAVDAEAVRATGRYVVLGGGRPVGSLRAVL
jgi:L-asparaginase II